MLKTKISGLIFLSSLIQSFYPAPARGVPEGPDSLPAQEPQDAGDPAKPGRLNTVLVVFFTICILASVSFLSYAVLVPTQGDAFTGFYVLGPDGKAGDYPATLHSGDSMQVIVGIANHEHRDVSYDLVVALTDSVNVSRLYEENVSVAAGLTWEKKIDLKPDLTGTGLKIELLLYADGNYTTPYRDLRLIVDVTQPPN
jgi:uncharacterized membrane protein